MLKQTQPLCVKLERERRSLYAELLSEEEVRMHEEVRSMDSEQKKAIVLIKPWNRVCNLLPPEALA